MERNSTGAAIAPQGPFWRFLLQSYNISFLAVLESGEFSSSPSQGVHPPWDHDAFPPCFRYPPYFRKMFRLWGKFSQFYLFSKNFLIFIRRNFRWLFFSHRPQTSNSPPFSLFQYISLCFAKIIIPPYFDKFPSLFATNSSAFYILYVYVYISPILWPRCIYASPNARTGRPWREMIVASVTGDNASAESPCQRRTRRAWREPLHRLKTRCTVHVQKS